MPFRSPYADVGISETDIFSTLFERDTRPPFPTDRVVLRDSDDLKRCYTFDQVRDACVQFGKGLKSQYGFKKGSVLALVAPNDIDFPIVACGTLWTGGSVSPANPGYTVSELVFQIKDSGSSVVACHPSVLGPVREACRQVGIPDSAIILLGARELADRKFKHWSQVVNAEGTARYRKPKIDVKQDLSFLVYSSGTTGKPKGVRLTHHNLTSNFAQIEATVAEHMSWDGSKKCPEIPDAPAGPGDKIIACLPMYHIYGLNLLALFTPIYSGCETIVMARFDLLKWCQIVQDYKITVSYVAPPIALGLCKHPAVDNYDLSSLRVMTSGAAPLSRELVEALYKRKKVRVRQSYGLSESSPTLFNQRWEDWWSKVGSTGLLLPNLEAKLCELPGVDEVRSANPKEVPQGEAGELFVRGPNVFPGYHNNEPATRECLSTDGWFRTGDVGYLDEDGNLFITDRAKELIKYKGFQVAPAELEGYLNDHPMIDDAAVIGVESKALATEIPRAYVVRKGGMKAVQDGDEEEILKWINGRVANHKKLRGGLKFIDVVPKSASGKILRKDLKGRAQKEVAEMEASKQPAKAKL